MNHQDYIIVDFETGSRNPHTTQPLQIAALVIDGRRLTIKENGIFQSLIRPITDEEQLEKLGLNKVEEEALSVNNLDMETVLKAPSCKTVFEGFANFVDMFNYEKSNWNAPILTGFNNNGFDDIIMNRLCREYGRWDKERGKNNLFHPIANLDVFKLIWPWFENSKLEVNSLSLDAMRDFFGMSREGAHDALVDVYDTAEIMIRFLKMYRHFMDNGLIEMKGRFVNRLVEYAKN